MGFLSLLREKFGCRLPNGFDKFLVRTAAAADKIRTGPDQFGYVLGKFAGRRAKNHTVIDDFQFGS